MVWLCIKEANGIFTQIGEIADTIPIVAPETKCDIVYNLFKSNPNLEGVAVMGEQSVSLMMRARFFQQIGTQYGTPCGTGYERPGTGRRLR